MSTSLSRLTSRPTALLLSRSSSDTATSIPSKPVISPTLASAPTTTTLVVTPTMVKPASTSSPVMAAVGSMSSWSSRPPVEWNLDPKPVSPSDICYPIATTTTRDSSGSGSLGPPYYGSSHSESQRSSQSGLHPSSSHLLSAEDHRFPFPTPTNQPCIQNGAGNGRILSPRPRTKRKNSLPVGDVSISSISVSFVLSPSLKLPRGGAAPSLFMKMKCGQWAAKTGKTTGVVQQATLVCAAWEGNWLIPYVETQQGTSQGGIGSKLEIELHAFRFCRQSKLLAKMFVSLDKVRGIASTKQNIDFGFGTLDVVLYRIPQLPLNQSLASSSSSASAAPPPTHISTAVPSTTFGGSHATHSPSQHPSAQNASSIHHQNSQQGLLSMQPHNNRVQDLPTPSNRFSTAVSFSSRDALHIQTHALDDSAPLPSPSLKTNNPLESPRSGGGPIPVFHGFPPGSGSTSSPRNSHEVGFRNSGLPISVSAFLGRQSLDGGMSKISCGSQHAGLALEADLGHSPSLAWG